MLDMEESFGVMLRQLPNKTEIPELLIDITQAGLGRGLQFVLFRPGKTRYADFYATLPIDVTVTGSYHEMGQFVSDLAALPRIVSLGNFKITPASGGRLSMSTVALTYHYLDEEEIAAQAASQPTSATRRRR
jgi:type IV pilus assembly protein PilO